MAEGDNPHFEISEELVHEDAPNVTGRSETYPREDFGEHGEFLVRQAQEFRASAAEARDSLSLTTHFLQVFTPAEIPIRREKQRLAEVGLELVSYSKTADNAGVARIDKDQFERLESRIFEYAVREDHPGRSYFSVIDDLRMVPADEKIAPALRESRVEKETTCIIYLYANLPQRELGLILEELQTFILSNDGEFLNAYEFTSGVTTALVRLRSTLLEQLGEEFISLQRIIPDRVYYVSESVPTDPLPNPPSNNPPRTSIGVGVVDSGITQKCPSLHAAVSHTIPQLPPSATAPHLEHGTFVASRIAFGDDVELEFHKSIVRPLCYLTDIPVFGVDSTGSPVPTDEYWLARSLDTAAKTLPSEVRVLNVSLGTDQPIIDEEYSLVATTLDWIAREYDLIVVTTAGNIRDPTLTSKYPHHVLDPTARIDPPGEALLAITVGSIARFGDHTAMAQPGELSPFSRVGPGADGSVKPELVSHGGNWHKPGRSSSRIATQGIYTDGRRLAWDVGTSFAAPLICRDAVELLAHYQNPSANFVKALLFHFADSVKDIPGVGNSINMCGFGQPNVERAKYAVENSAVFVYTGSMTINAYKYIPFYVPDLLHEKSKGKLRIRGTLVFNPPVNQSNPAEYSQSRMSILMRKPMEVGFREFYLSNHMICYQPWSPIIQFDKNFSYSYKTGIWELRTRLFTRDQPDDFEQSFALIIEVIDDNGGLDVWSAVREEAGSDFRPVAIRVAA